MRWSYPELAELDRALAQCCDAVLSDETVLVRELPTRMVYWRYRDREFRVTYRAPGWARPLSPLGYLRWRRGQSFGTLPTQPEFAWRMAGDPAWRLALDLASWQRALAGRGGAAPDDFAGRAVRPLGGPPTLRAGAEAVPELVE
jgi:hypothetical protein